MNIRSRKESAEIESAITFLVEKINEYNSNPKPLILHSLRVGLRLFEKGESKKVVIAGLLHDLQEDTKCTNQDIAAAFGSDIAEFVDLFDYDDPHMHYKPRWTAAMRRMVAWGRDAAIVKIVDINDNLKYLDFSKKGKEVIEGLLWRHQLVRDSFKDLLRDDEDYRAYARGLEEKKKELIDSPAQ